MSERVKCPCCGSGLDLETVWTNCGPWYSCLSESCWFQCSKSDLPRISAAMELAKSTDLDMKRDITTTLRTQAQMYRQMANPAQGDILDEAAGEIERLRELRDAVKRFFTSAPYNQSLPIDEMSDEEYSAWYKERTDARAEVDRLLGEE